jgi:hypothetical protein
VTGVPETHPNPPALAAAIRQGRARTVPTGEPMTDPTTETARALLYRHGLPEDVIDGVLCLHAQELAAVQRREAAVWGVDTAAGKHTLAAADLIDPTRGAVSAVSLPPADQTALRDRLDEAIDDVFTRWESGLGGQRPQDAIRDAVLAVLPATTDQTAEAPLSPDYSHEACGFHWHGRDGMDIPMRDGQPVCPRCELAEARAQIGNLRTMYDASEARVNDLIEERDQLLEARADRAAVLREVERHVRELARATFQPYYRSAYATLADDIIRMDDETQPAETERCAHCAHPKRDHDGRADHRAKYPPHVVGDPWCHACNTECDYTLAKSCAHCGQPVSRVIGTLTAWWVHAPGGNTVCDPQQAASSPRATPEPAAGARQDGAQPS